MIPQDVIDGYLADLFGHSKPGQVIHHLLVAVAQTGGTGALGIPKLEATLYAIAPTEVDAEQLVHKTIMAATVAGTVSGPHERVGAPGRQERDTYQRLIRAAVGIEPLPLKPDAR